MSLEIPIKLSALPGMISMTNWTAVNNKSQAFADSQRGILMNVL